MYQTTDCWDSNYGGYCRKYTKPMVPAVVLWNPSSPLFWGHAFCGCFQAWLSTAALRQVHSRRCRIPLMGTFSFRTPRQPCQNFLELKSEGLSSLFSFPVSFTGISPAPWSDGPHSLLQLSLHFLPQDFSQKISCTSNPILASAAQRTWTNSNSNRDLVEGQKESGHLMHLG